MDRNFNIYAIDFDGTIVTDKFPEIGEAIPTVQNFIKVRQAQGDKFILWTCRTKEYLQAAIDYCRSQGIVFDAINCNIPWVTAEYGNDPRKVFADFYIDDKNTVIVNDLGQSLTTLRMVGEEDV